ncbi:MAG TPA: hypothetical protein P5538_04970 [Bacteroidales bacterium]|nr:hypothetical protein [Bacteroidales bacterium]HOL98264.1 hypothetical protein [Bacteroidales bacterium]HPD24043.1 hypothetical protein [Bacteroidales bacterium]HRT80279.1 hypothetical protein [Bacteroidales bacterium]
MPENYSVLFYNINTDAEGNKTEVLFDVREIIELDSILRNLPEFEPSEASLKKIFSII